MIDDFRGEDSTEYDAGFEAGSAGKPCDGTTPGWLSGWADAQDFRSVTASSGFMHTRLKHSSQKLPRRLRPIL
jgi:hypothetical protein